MKFPAIMALAAAGVGAAGLAYARFIEPGRFDITHHELTLPGLTGIGMGWWAAGFVAFLAFGAWGMSRLEQRFAHLRPQG